MNTKKLVAVMLVFAFVATSFAAVASAKQIKNLYSYASIIDHDTVMRDSNGNVMLFKDGVQVAFVYNAGTFFIVYDANGAHITKSYIIYNTDGHLAVKGSKREQPPVLPGHTPGPGDY